MRPYINRANKIADGQYDDYNDCNRVTKVKCKSKIKKRMLRGFKKSMRQKLKANMRNTAESETETCQM